MKKLSILLLLLVLVSSGALADEVVALQDASDNRAVITVQKQPANEQQKQEVKQNKWCIIIQVNGKVKDLEK